MDVDVPNACETITDPSAPMALRLQGNLLCVPARAHRDGGANALTVTEYRGSSPSNVLTS